MKMMCQYANVSMCQCAVLLYRRLVGTLAHWHIGMLAHYSIVILFLFLGSLPVAAQILQPMPIVEEKVEYDALTNRYLIRTIIGGQEMDVPIIMTPAEYLLSLIHIYSMTVPGFTLGTENLTCMYLSLRRSLKMNSRFIFVRTVLPSSIL